MPHLIGLQLHSDGIAVAALRPDQTLVLRPVNDLASVLQRAAAQRWKWSLDVEGREAGAVAAARSVFLGLQHAMGDERILAGVAVPAKWGDRARAALLLSMEGTLVETLRLVRDTTALAVGASLIDPSIAGLCALVHVGTHKLEVTLAEVSAGAVRARARQSVVGLDGANIRFESLLPLITEVAHFTARQAGIADRDVRRLVCAGRRAADPALANPMGGVFGLAAEVFPEGTLALGAAHVAVGLSGMHSPWNLLDDLDEPPLASYRGGAHGGALRSSTPSPRAPTPSPRAPTPSPRAPTPSPRAPTPEPRAPMSPLRPPTAGPLAPTPPPSAPTPAAHPPAAARIPSAPPGAVDEVVERHRPTERPPAPSDAYPTVESGHSGEHPSYAPAGTHVAEVAASGSFTGLPNLDAVRALHMLHPADAAALAHPTLAALLNQFTFLRTASGTLTLRHRGEEVTLPIERGGVCVPLAERPRAWRPFEWTDGTYAWRPEKIPWPTQKHRVPMTTFVVGGIRLRLRALDDGEFSRGHRSRLRLAPAVLDERRSRLARLALPDAEERAVDHVIDGSRSFEAMLGEGYIGRTTLHRLVVLLDLYGILRWAPPAAAATADPVAEMTRLLSRIEGANHFVALGVHWSAPTDEIRQAWDQMQSLYGPGGDRQRLAPTVATRILQRGAAAWAVLRHDGSRVLHRREAYPGMDEELLAPLVEARAKALEMRGETTEAARMMLLRGEFHVHGQDEEAVARPRPKPRPGGTSG